MISLKTILSLEPQISFHFKGTSEPHLKWVGTESRLLALIAQW